MTKASSATLLAAQRVADAMARWVVSRGSESQTRCGQQLLTAIEVYKLFRLDRGGFGGVQDAVEEATNNAS